MRIDITESFPFTVEQTAMLTGYSVRTIQRAIKRHYKDPQDRYALRANQSGPRGKLSIEAAEVDSYKKRTSSTGILN